MTALPSTLSRGPGRVWLLGAGPGDLELLTLKAVRVLGEADVLLLDDLVNRQIVQFAPQANVVHVGKRGGCKSTPQAFILRLMRRYARQGKTVVRVKGGEPMLFGRAGEEIGFLQAAGIDVQVINGVTSAIAAATSLGASLTHREHCRGVTFVTAHAQDGGEPDWQALAATGCTLAIYMGLNRVERVAAGLMQVLPADTPAAAVMWASTPRERKLVTTLAALPAAVRSAGFESPTVLLVGEAMAEAVGVVDVAVRKLG